MDVCVCEHAVSGEVSEQNSTYGIIDRWAVIFNE